MQLLGLALGALMVALLVALNAAEAQSGGAILINVRAGGQPAKAEVVVSTATDEAQEVAKGRSGTPIPVPSGNYDVQITCSELIDHPTQDLRGVTVGGETVTREANFEAGTVTLHVKRGGSVLRGSILHFTKVGGGEAPGTAKTGEPFRASPGQYEAAIDLGKGRSKISHTISGIQVYDGATRNIPVSL
jgi:hypothetical protein